MQNLERDAKFKENMKKLQAQTDALKMQNLERDAKFKENIKNFKLKLMHKR